jgi:hypothetical protein
MTFGGTSVLGTERTNQAGLALSVVRGRPEVKLRGRQDRCWTQSGN